jgi:hypothetical protein
VRSRTVPMLITPHTWQGILLSPDLSYPFSWPEGPTVPLPTSEMATTHAAKSWAPQGWGQAGHPGLPCSFLSLTPSFCPCLLSFLGAGPAPPSPVLGFSSHLIRHERLPSVSPSLSLWKLCPFLCSRLALLAISPVPPTIVSLLEPRLLVSWNVSAL